MKEVDKVRVDKWLWAVRLFKSRSLASDIVKSGKVKLGGKTVKASYAVQTGDKLEVKKNGFTLQVEVVKKIEKRVGAPLAAACFNDLTPVEEMNKYKNWFIGKGQAEFRERGEGRPTKKERREIDDFKFYYLEDEEDDLN